MDAGGLTSDVSIVRPCTRRLQPLGYNQGRERFSECGWDDPFLEQNRGNRNFAVVLAGVFRGADDGRPEAGHTGCAAGKQGGDGEATQARDIQAAWGASPANAAGTGAADSRADACGAAAGHVQQW